jgi:hypothetical protein
VEESALDHEAFDLLNYESYTTTLGILYFHLELVIRYSIRSNLHGKIYRAKQMEVVSRISSYPYILKMKSYEEVATHWDPKI